MDTRAFFNVDDETTTTHMHIILYDLYITICGQRIFALSYDATAFPDVVSHVNSVEAC